MCAPVRLCASLVAGECLLRTISGVLCEPICENKSYLFNHFLLSVMFMYEIHNLKNIIDDCQFLIIAKIVIPVHKDVKM